MKIVGIGASAGGLQALKEFFSTVRPGSNSAFVVVTHLPNNTPTSLDVILARITPLSIRILLQDTQPVPDTIYILPGSCKVQMSEGMLIVRSRTNQEIINSAIDEFLFSLAEDQKANATAIIFSGASSDGAHGAARVSQLGGTVMVQDPNSAQFKTMPNAAIQADHPTTIAVPRELANTISNEAER